MKHFDLYTIIWISSIGTFAMGLCLLTVSTVYFGRIRGITYWAIATLFQSVGWMGLALRDVIPSFISIIIGNSVIVLSVSMYLNVIARFKNKNTKTWLFYVPSVLNTLLLLYFTYVMPNMPARRIVIAYVSGILMFLCSYFLLADKKHRPSSHLFTGIAFLLTGVLLFARGIILSQTHFYPDENFYTPSTGQDISYMWFYITSLLFTIGFMLMCIDRYIDESKMNAALLSKSEEKYRNIVENAQEGIWLGDEHYNTVFVNQRMAAILETSTEEMVGRSAFDFIDVEDRAKANQVIERRRQGFSDQHEFRFKTKEGKHKWASLSSTPILLEDGRFNGVMVMVMDITEKFEAAKKLTESEKRLKEAQKIARIGDYHYDFRTKIWKCSQIVDEISGLRPEEIPDFDKWIALIPEEYRAPYMKDITDAIIEGNEGGFSKYRDYKIIQAHTGEEKWIAVTGKMKFNDKGAPLEMIGTVQDVTDRKKEEELIQSNMQLRNLSVHLQAVREEERTHIAREIHDELGQQLTAIKIEATRWNNKIKKEAPQFSTEISGLIGMVNNGISTVRKIATELRGGLLNELGLETAIESHTTEFQKSTGLKTELEIDLDRENFSEDVVTNVFRIYQEALTNIVRHAKATKVKTRLYTLNQTLVLEVIDNGIGISKESPSRTTLGILGMKERTAMLKGKITFHNLEKGTSITLKIPL